MKEVEIKIKIADVNQVIKQLENKGCHLEPEIIQEDIVYIPQEQPSVPVPAGMNVLRIRKQPDKTIFTLKQSVTGNNLAKVEKEMEITDAKVAEEIIKLLGFKEIAHTTKARRVCHINNYEICIDRVKELGDFLEIEKITNDDPFVVQKEMIDYLLELGIDASERIDVGYDVLFVRKNLQGRG